MSGLGFRGFYSCRGVVQRKLVWLSGHDLHTKADLVNEIIRLDKEKCQLQMELGSLHKELDMIKSAGPRIGIDNAIIGSYGTPRSDPNLKSHTELVELLDASNSYRDLRLAFNRFMTRILKEYGCETSNSVFMTRKDPGGKYFPDCNPSGEGLFEVICDGSVRYAIPNCGSPFGQIARSFEIPNRYILYRSCLQEEVVAHGCTRSSFPCIDKVEQVCITDQNVNTKGIKMLSDSKRFYGVLDIPIRTVSIGRNALGGVLVKFIIEGWFPASQAYVKLASLSMLKVSDILYNGRKRSEELDECVCLVNSITEPEHTIGCILENYQTKDGIAVPILLQSSIHGKSLLRFRA